MSDEYRRAMDALARETKLNPVSGHRIESELVRAITRHTIAQREITQHRIAWRRRLGGRSWLSLAAAIVLIAGALGLWEGTRSLPRPEQTLAGPRNNEPSPPPTVMVEKAPPAASHSNPPDTLRPSRARNTPRKANVVRPSGFVELPWSAGLPAFESGEIVRMELPVATLPTYGIDISSGAVAGPVEADVLIGQDGFARAIRLVPSTTTTRSTQ